MSEKRFIVLPNNVVWDNQLNEVVCRCILEGIGDAENVCQRMNQQQATIIKLQDTLFVKEKTIGRLENTIAHLNEADDYLKKNRKITELANIIYNMKMVLSNDEKQITKIIEAYQDEIDKWKGRTAILLKERWKIE